MRLALVLPDGVGVRNFVLGQFAHRAAELGTVLTVHALPPDLLALNARAAGLAVNAVPLLPYRPGRALEVLGSATGYAHMYWAQTEAMRRRLARPVSGTTAGRRAMQRAARAVGRMAARPAGIRLLDRAYLAAVGRAPEVAHYRTVFARIRPTVLFCTSQRAPECVAPVLAARALGIPTAAYIFSWDNLTSKQRIAAPFEHYFVWSALMRDELLRYHPEVRAERVHVVGTPQFDAYADPAVRWTREEFCQRVGADPGRAIVCYSGGDAGTCPDDAHHLRMLLSLVRAGRIAGRPQVLLRPSPVDDGSRYAAVRRDFPELLYAPPAWVHTAPGDWSHVVPMPEDRALLANLVRHCDVNVNVASTMSLDFALHDRPVVNIAFDATSPPPLGRPLHDVYYRYEHYRPVVELGATRVVRDGDALAAAVDAYLAEPGLDREARRRFAELEVRLPLGDAGRRTAEALARIAAGAAAVAPARAPRVPGVHPVPAVEG